MLAPANGIAMNVRSISQPGRRFRAALTALGVLALAFGTVSKTVTRADVPATTQPFVAAAIHADVLISAGHEGRPQSCAFFPKRHCNLGAAGERNWTPIVADAATRVLRAHGISVLRLPADFEGTYDVQTAAFVHLDGGEPPCTSGASIGYHDHGAGRAAAQLWRSLYEPRFPFRFQSDNFTGNLRDYYGFRQVRAREGALVVELGEITCPAQRRWLEPRLQWAGELLAYALARAARLGGVPDPGVLRQ